LFGTSTKDAYVLKNIPGLIVIPNAFAPKQQRYLIKRCLFDYPQAPNTSNLHTHYEVPSQGIWPLFEQQRHGTLNESDPDFYVQKKSTTQEDATYSDSEEEEPVTACSDDFTPILDGPKADPPPAPGVPLLAPSELVRKLRWVTLGYQYHWPTKTYHLDRRHPFPDDVSELTKAVVTAVEGIGHEWQNRYKGDEYRAEAGVVNYYQYRDALMGHVDRSELNMDAPLVSLRLEIDNASM
jgi:alkylated DNA repair protein alkB family protein 1